MKKRSRTLVLAVLAGLSLSLGGCGGGSAPSAPVGATLAGQVLIPEGRAPAGLTPAAGAEVGLFAWSASGEAGAPVRRARTDAHGRYTFAGIAPGRYEVRANADRGGRTLELATLAQVDATPSAPPADCDPETTVALAQVRGQLENLEAAGIPPEEFPNLTGLFARTVEDVRTIVSEDPSQRTDCSDPDQIRAKLAELAARRAPEGHYIGQAVDERGVVTYIGAVVDPNDGSLLIVGLCDDWGSGAVGGARSPETGAEADDGPDLLMNGDVAADGRFLIQREGMRVFGFVNRDYGTGEWAEMDDQGRKSHSGTWELRRCVQPNSGLWFGWLDDSTARPDERYWGVLLVPDAGLATLLAGTALEFAEADGRAPLFARIALTGNAAGFSYAGPRPGDDAFRLAADFDGVNACGTVTLDGREWTWTMVRNPDAIEDAYADLAAASSDVGTDGSVGAGGPRLGGPPPMP